MAAHHINRDRKSNRASILASVEMLEPRRMLSAELLGSFASAVPAALPPAVVNYVSVRVNNQQGRTESGPVTVSLYLSETTSLGEDAIILGTATRKVHLRGAKSTAFPFRFVSPSAVTTGDECLLARIDGPANPDGSTNETLVVSPQTVAVFQSTVDLSGQIAAMPTTLSENGTCPPKGQTRVQVVNTGNSPARGPLQITIYASADGAVDSTAIEIGLVRFPAVNIRAGGSHTFAVPLSVPQGMPLGSYTVLASINSSGTIVETNMANNVAVGQHPLTLANTPVVIDLRRHSHDHNIDGGTEADVGIDTCDQYTDSDGQDTSGDDTAALADDSGSDDSNQPSTAAESSGGGGADFGDNSGGDTSGGDNSSADCSGADDSGGDDSGGGSDFGDASPVDSGGGSDFSADAVHRPAPVSHAGRPIVRRAVA